MVRDYGIDYIFGLSGNVVLDRLVDAAVDDIRVRRAVNQAEVLRGFAETRYAAKSWDKERQVVARIEASASHADDMLRRGIDIRYVVTSLQGSDAEHIYETIYCAPTSLACSPRASAASSVMVAPLARPIANVECSQAGIGIARAIPVRSHFLGSCGRNVALVQYLIGPMSGKTVTRADLYRAIYQKVGLSRTQSAPLVELVLKEITDCLERGETVKLSSFGLFVVRQKGQRLGRNPRTGEEVPISPRRVVVFKPSAVLKQRINAPRSPFR